MCQCIYWWNNICKSLSNGTEFIGYSCCRLSPPRTFANTITEPQTGIAKLLDKLQPNRGNWISRVWLRKWQYFVLCRSDDIRRPLPADIGRIFRPLLADIGRIFRPLLADIGRIFRPLPADTGRIFRPLLADIGRIFRPLPADIGRIFRPLPADIGRIFRPLPADIGRIFRPLPADIGRIFRPLPVKFQLTSLNYSADIGRIFCWQRMSVVPSISSIPIEHGMLSKPPTDVWRYRSNVSFSICQSFNYFPIF